jgi:hypothetical protein
MSKDDFTKQKNRISAQLSRVRRNAIMQSLIQVCIFNIKAKMEQDEDIEEVKQVLKEHLCRECKGKFTGNKCPNDKPSTLSNSPSNSPSHRDNRPAVTFSRGGAFNIFMSLALVACIMSVAFIGTGEHNNGSYPALDVSNPSSGNRFLRGVEEQLPIPVCSQTQGMSTQQDIDRMLKNARIVYLNRDGSLVDSINLYQNMDFSDCETIKQKCGSVSRPTEESPSFVAQKLNKTFEDFDMNTPVPFSHAKESKEVPTFFFGNSKQLNNEPIYIVQKDGNQVKFIVQADDFMKDQEGGNLLNSLGAAYEPNSDENIGKFMQFTCSIDSIDLLTGDERLFQGLA